MGRRIPVTDGGVARRWMLFAVVFGGAMGFVAWLAGGISSSSNAPRSGAVGPEAPAHPGETAPIGPAISVGESTDASLSHDAVKVLGGKTVRYRSWTVAWKKSTPRKGPTPEIGVQDVVLPHLALYPEPQSAASAPVAEGAPGTTRITSQTAVLEYEKDVSTRVRLAGDVAVDRFDPERGDFRVRTATLDCILSSSGPVERRSAKTVDPVSIDGGGIHLDGTGLESDLVGDDVKATVLSAVKARYEAPSGALTQTGGEADSPRLPTDVTCSGPCELVSLDAKLRGGNRRWRATFHDAVHVVQGEDTLDCDLLEIEFRMGESQAKGAPPPQHVVATGHVRVKGRTESHAFEVTSQKATHSQEGPLGKEADVVVFEGSPVMNIFGRMGAAADPKGAAAPVRGAPKGRLEIRCDDPVTMRTERSGRLPTSPFRTHVVFEKNVVARQWDDEKAAAPTGEMRAAKASLNGLRLSDGRMQPEYVTAEGGVDLKHVEFVSHSDAATWERLSLQGVDQGIDRYMLSGKPVVTCAGVRALLPFQKATKAVDSKMVATTDDGLRLDVYEERPAESGKPRRPLAVISGGPKAVLTQSVDGAEVSRITADQIDATIAQGRQLETASGTGSAHLSGLDADGAQRDLFGAKVTLDELVLPPGAPKDAPHPSRVTAVGDRTTSALAVLREKDGKRHDVRAQVLRYDEDGSVITAQTEVVVNVDTKNRDDRPGSGVGKAVNGGIRITAPEARVELEPQGAGAQTKSRVRHVTARGGVVIDGGWNRITGDEVVYDAASGIAEVRGRDSRVVNSAESERFTSFLTADLIRAYFEVSDDPKKDGQLVRTSCPDGGLIVRYLLPPDAVTGLPVAGAKPPRRIQIHCTGPIEATRNEATAVGDVKSDIYELTPTGQWTLNRGTVYCDRAHMTFDADAKGDAKDRLRTLTATGDEGRQVILETPDIRARADRIEVDGLTSKVRMSTTSDKDVYVRELATGRQCLYESATYDYVTFQVEDAVRMQELEPDKIAEPEPQSPKKGR